MSSVGLNRTVVVIGSGLAIAGIWAAVVAAHNRKTSRDQKAVAFFSELQRELAPDSVGLVESEAFDIKYWQNISLKLKKKVVFLKGSGAMNLSDTIRASWHWYNNDENKLFAVLRGLKDQVAVSQVAYYYYINIKDPKNKINLIDEIKSKLGTEDVRTILDIVKKLPKYTLAK